MDAVTSINIEARDKFRPERVMLTDSRVRALASADKGKRYSLWDAQQPGLAIRVTDKGAKSFVVARRRPGDKAPTFVVLGRYPMLTLKAARDKAPGVLSMLARGEHPREIEKRKHAEDAKRRADTVATVAEDFIKRHVKTLRTARDVEYTIRRELLGQKHVEKIVDAKAVVIWLTDDARKDHWRDRPIAEISRRDVVELIERVVDCGHRYQARKLLAYVRKLFNWAIARDIYGIEASPCDRIKPRELIGRLESRKRVLNDDELRLVWHASLRLGERRDTVKPLHADYPFGPLTRMIILTGQRLREWSDARRPEIQKNLLIVPPDRMKGDDAEAEAHTVPLTQSALELLDALPRWNQGDYLFSTTGGERPVSGFSKAKARLDAIIAAMRAEARAGEGALPEDQDYLPRWTFHDLRRTLRTRLSGLGVTDTVAELVIGHKQHGVRAVYDLHRYDAEKRDALERWERALFAIINPPADNAVPLRSSGAADD